MLLKLRYAHLWQHVKRYLSHLINMVHLSGMFSLLYDWGKGCHLYGSKHETEYKLYVKFYDKPQDFK